MERIAHEPAYVLHHYDWSETGLVIETLTLHYGRVALIAKGAKRPCSNFRTVLLPMQPLLLSWSGKSEVRTLKKAEWGGGPVMPGGAVLTACWYANELVLRLLAREDPHPALYRAYAAFMTGAAGGGLSLSAGLRAFELVLLRRIGLLPDLGCLSDGDDLQTEAAYALLPGVGLQPTDADPGGLSGRDWLLLQSALLDDDSFAALIGVLAALTPPQRNGLRRSLRALLDDHGTRRLHTRDLLHSLRQFSLPSPGV